MTAYFAKSVLLPDGWASDVRIACDARGRISGIQTGEKPDNAQVLNGAVVPGMPNLHSHAFQRAMAGLTEYAANPSDNFWSWRELMYRFVRTISPEDMEAVAAQLYVEMLKGGYTGIAEFHYVHHDTDGIPYQDRALLSRHIISAAGTAGIGITHIPVLYAYGNFGEESAHDGQRRFLNTPEQLIEILETLRKDYANDPQVSFGLSHHSLRAVSLDMMRAATQAARMMDPDIRIHMHLAEQEKEVADCLAWCGKRPAELLFDTVEIDRRWTLIHCTHLADGEVSMIAGSGAVAGLCPTTEANLGDGVFRMPDYIAAGGGFGIGSDSNICASVAEELRMIEYAQRLTYKKRNICQRAPEIHVGAFLYKKALGGGAQALGFKQAGLVVGGRADLVVLDCAHPALYGRKGDALLDAYVFSSTGSSPVRDVICGGAHVIRNGHHAQEEKIYARYKTAIQNIAAD